MTSKSEPHPHEMANFAENPFEQLPRDILLPMVKLTFDLATLWSLSRVSRAVYLLIDDFGKEIVETVLNASEPKHIRFLVGPIALLKLGVHPSTSLDDFKRRYVRPWSRISTESVNDTSLKNLSVAERLKIIEYRYGLLPKETSPMVLHTILQTAYKINRLTHSCHKHFIDRCKTLEICELIRPIFSGHIRQLDVKQSECRKYSICETAAPSWIEEKRIARAFWYVQMFYDLRNNSEKLCWTNSDLDRLRSMDIEQFYEGPVFSPVTNAILTTVLYLREASEASSIQPAQQAVHFLQLPQPGNSLPIVFLPAEPIFEDGNSDVWGEGVHCLDNAYRIPGIFVPAMCLTNNKRSPRRDVPYEHFRRLGFAIWDRKRMFAFGLANEAGKPEIVFNTTEMIFKYLRIPLMDKKKRRERV